MAKSLIQSPTHEDITPPTPIIDHSNSYNHANNKQSVKRKNSPPPYPDVLPQLSSSGEDSDELPDSCDSSDDNETQMPPSKKSRSDATFPPLEIAQSDVDCIEKMINNNEDPTPSTSDDISSLLKKCESMCTPDEKQFLDQHLLPIVKKHPGKLSCTMLADFTGLCSVHKLHLDAFEKIDGWQNKCQAKVDEFVKRMNGQGKIFDRQLVSANAFVKSIDKNSSTLSTAFKQFFEKNSSSKICKKCVHHCLPNASTTIPRFSGKPPVNKKKNTPPKKTPKTHSFVDKTEKNHSLVKPKSTSKLLYYTTNKNPRTPLDKTVSRGSYCRSINNDIAPQYHVLHNHIHYVHMRCDRPLSGM